MANTLVQGTSFAVVGLLVARLRGALARERALSRTDPLSGLLNSRAFHEEAVRLSAIYRRAARPLTIAYVDLDNFKLINDTHGHNAGDERLRTIGRQYADLAMYDAKRSGKNRIRIEVAGGGVMAAAAR